jgi:uncharacterized protein YndB with AHSA1/START domain
VTKEEDMAAVVHSIEISRRPEDVFSYATDFARFPTWQGGVVSSRSDGGDALPVGSTATVTRQIGRRRLSRTEEITEFDPPRRWAVRGIGGPLAAIATGTIEPLAGGQRSRLTIALDFKGRGIGKLLVPLLIRRQARRQLPHNEQRLKDALERGA